MALLTKWVHRAAVAFVIASLLGVFVWQRVVVGDAVGTLTAEYEKAGVDVSDCRSLTKSPYVTGDGRCLERSMKEIATKLPQQDLGSRGDYEIPQVPQEEPPIE
jgi:hypothetical protein